MPLRLPAYPRHSLLSLNNKAFKCTFDLYNFDNMYITIIIIKIRMIDTLLFLHRLSIILILHASTKPVLHLILRLRGYKSAQPPVHHP